MHPTMTIGLARMHLEPGERRDFLPNFVGRLDRLGARLILEREYGSGIGLEEDDYRRHAASVTFASRDEVYTQDYVLVLRSPGDEDMRRMRRGACLISMLHYPTRPARVAFMRTLGIEAVSLDSIKDDNGRRLVENLRAVAWNGIEAAMRLLRDVYPPPGFDSPRRPPIQVTLLGAGAVGAHVVQAAARYGDDALRRRLVATGVPGVQVNVVDHDITGHAAIMRDLLSRTDILVDATQRPDTGRPVVPNEWIGSMPGHAVLLDLSVDPYDPDAPRPSVKGIEGIPQGNLDKYVFRRDDPVFDQLPAGIVAKERRHSVSCYSWPGVHPRRCMEVYGRQLRPLLRKLIEKGGVQRIDPHGSFFERAIARSRLSLWTPDGSQPPARGGS